MAREARALQVGTVRIRGADLAFVPQEASFTVRAGERVALSVHFQYEERSPDKEQVRVMLAVELDGEKLGVDERVIDDRRARLDDEWSHVSVGFRAPAAGPVKGRFRIDASYAVGPWDDESDDTWRLGHDGEFTLDVQ